MSKVTLAVPEEYAEDFRAAIVEEIASDIAGLKTNRKELAERRWRMPDRPNGDEDVRNIERLLERDVALATQIGVSHVRGEIAVHSDDVATVQFAFETMARDIVGPRLAEELSSTPIDRNQATRIGRLIEEVSWAVERAGELERGAVTSEAA